MKNKKEEGVVILVDGDQNKAIRHGGWVMWAQTFAANNFDFVWHIEGDFTTGAPVTIHNDYTPNREKGTQVGVKDNDKKRVTILNPDDENIKRWVFEPVSAAQAATLTMNQCLTVGKSIYSANRNYRLTMQTDGNVVIYGDDKPAWHTNTYGKGAIKLCMQGDGNLIAYNQTSPVWASNTHRTGSSPYKLVMQDDGDLVIYDSGNQRTWSSRDSAAAAAVAEAAKAAAGHSITGSWGSMYIYGSWGTMQGRSNFTIKKLGTNFYSFDHPDDRDSPFTATAHSPNHLSFSNGSSWRR